MARKKYSAKERKAYHMGRAYQTAKVGKRVKCPDEKTKQSFRNGVNSVKGKVAVKSNEQHTCNVVKSYVPGLGNCLIDGDGCIVKVLYGGK